MATPPTVTNRLFCTALAPSQDGSPEPVKVYVECTTRQAYGLGADSEKPLNCYEDRDCEIVMRWDLTMDDLVGLMAEDV